MHLGNLGLIEYSHAVHVSAESGEVLGPAHFVGRARINRKTGGRRWSSDPHTNIDPLVLAAAGTLCLAFDNGAVGYASCTSTGINPWSERGALFLVRLLGQGEPPRVDTGRAFS